MKKGFALLILFLTATQALAQGKILLVNDSLHLVYWTTDTSRLFPQDAGLAGHAYVLGDGNQTLTIELWAGTSSSALSLVASTDFLGQPSAGRWGSKTVTLPTPAGSTFFQIDIYDAAAGSFFLAETTPGHYVGQTPIFMAIAGNGIGYPSIVNHNPPVNSTWADGTFNLDSLSPGYRGAIELGLPIPEPGSFGLALLAFAILLLHHSHRMRHDSVLSGK